MRKDYMAAERETDSETDFLKQFWTDHWAAVAWQPTNHRRLRFREEYRILHKYLWPQQGAEVLDGGCGLGEWAVFLAESGFKITALDISPTVVERMQEVHPEIKAIAGDVRDTGFADDAFDAYYSWGVFEHFETDVHRCIAEPPTICEYTASLGLILVKISPACSGEV